MHIFPIKTSTTAAGGAETGRISGIVATLFKNLAQS